jgi:hypothetical protein
MKKITFAFITLLTFTHSGIAASLTNKDANPQTLIVTEGADKSELSVSANETVEFCETGCFVTMPNGDRQALTGAETIEISKGLASIK